MFIGSGEVVAIPPDAIEKQELYKFTGSPVLNEPFHAAIFRFTDNTYADIMKQFSQHAEETVSDDDAAQFLPLDQTVTDRSGLLNFRILADFLEPAGQELFWGEINGEKLGWFDVMYDQRLVEEAVQAEDAAHGIPASIGAAKHEIEKRQRVKTKRESTF